MLPTAERVEPGETPRTAFMDFIRLSVSKSVVSLCNSSSLRRCTAKRLGSTMQSFACAKSAIEALRFQVG